MKVLITGGTGYVGSALREAVKNAGHDVRLLVRPESEHKVVSGAYEIAHGSIFNTNACLRATDGVDAVIHLVGLIREFPSRGVTFDEYHRQATKNIVESAEISGVGRILHMSALGTSEHAKSAYHQTKWAGEEVVRNSKLRWTIFRPAWIFSRGDELCTQFKKLAHMPLVPLFDGGETMQQPVALEDVCACFVRALEMPETQGQTYELAGPDRVAFKDILGTVASTLGAHVKTVSVPSKLIAPFVQVLQQFQSFPLTVDQLKMLSEDNVAEIDRFVKTFGLEPKSFSKALPGLVT